MAEEFTFLSTEEFERLSSEDKKAYLTRAMAELSRHKSAGQHGWHNLFRQPEAGQQPQQQQQQQPQRDPHSRDDPKRPDSK
jgi:hypothetical protein